MNIAEFIIPESTTIFDAMKIINANAKQIAFVCENESLLAVLTDGDIRRHILRGGSVSDTVKLIANYNPHCILNTENTDVRKYLLINSINAVPIIDSGKKILSIEFLHNKTVYSNTDLRIPVVIQAGGKGSRLKPYTQILPKPLIPIGESTIIELIMDQFELFKCEAFHVIVNYKKNFIKAYFLDNEKKRNIDFIDETNFLGTGGGLKLLSGKFQSTFFMSNCDILVEDDYSKILKFHQDRKNIITMVCAAKKVVIPYGTVEVDENGRVLALTEKPEFSFMTNTGFYVIEPCFIDKIPADTFIHITDVIQHCIEDGENVGMFPICENAWMDMGQMEELEKMRIRFDV